MIYMHASSQSLHAIESVYHGALRFITNLKTLIHHCWVGWVCFVHLQVKTLACFYLQIYAGFTVKNPVCSYSLRSQEIFVLSVPVVLTELGKKSLLLPLLGIIC